MSVVKVDTRKVFDPTKIGVEDVVEYSEWGYSFFCKPKPVRRVAGIVDRVREDELVIHEKDTLAGRQVTRKFGFPVERAEELRIIFRHPDNAKEASAK